MKVMPNIKLSQHGQMILVLILVLVVVLGIGLSVVQKSLVDVSTSTKVEESSRAFSAAEAGIEKVLQSGIAIPTPIPLGNEAEIKSVEKSDIPKQPQEGETQVALEYPPLAKEEIAQVWLADLYSPGNPPDPFYTQNSLDVYWGQQNITDDAEKPAIEIKVIEYSNNDRVYTTRPFYLDSNSTRASSSGFCDANSNCTNPSVTSSCASFTDITTTSGPNRSFLCKSTLNGLSPTLTLMFLRARILYSSKSQPFAVQAVGTGAGRYLPTQAKTLTSIGTSGETQRKVSVFRLDKVVPHYFDYAIFSSGDISK